MTDLEPMTDQQIFDTVARHIMAQGEPAISQLTGKCAYLTPRGHKCAIGCLIPPEDYDAKFEDKGITNPVFNPLIRKHRWNVSLLADLQGAHDSWANSPYDGYHAWKLDMYRIAKNFELSPQVLSNDDASENH